MAGHKSFSELRGQLSPERAALIQEKVTTLTAEIPRDAAMWYEDTVSGHVPNPPTE